MPCSDSVGIDQYGSELQYHADSGNDNGDVDFCSPFCGSSCQTNIILQQPSEFQLVLPDALMVSQYPSGLVKKVIRFILQPPQV